MNARYIALALVVMLVCVPMVSAEVSPNHMPHVKVSNSTNEVSIVESLLNSASSIYSEKPTKLEAKAIKYPYVKSIKKKSLVPVEANNILRIKKKVVVEEKQLPDYSVNVVKNTRSDIISVGGHNITRGSIKGAMIR